MSYDVHAMNDRHATGETPFARGARNGALDARLGLRLVVATCDEGEYGRGYRVGQRDEIERLRDEIERLRTVTSAR